MDTTAAPRGSCGEGVDGRAVLLDGLVAGLGPPAMVAELAGSANLDGGGVHVTRQPQLRAPISATE